MDYENVPERIKEVPNDPKFREIRDEALKKDPHPLAFVTDYLNTQEMCSEAVQNKSCMLLFVPD